jgi:isopenicillin N synthase-like dioxygenase
MINQSLPLIDVSALASRGEDMAGCVNEIDRACRESGFFRMTGRGWFPVGGELTSGVPDLKEGLYVGEESLSSGVPLHHQGTYSHVYGEKPICAINNGGSLR